MKVDELRRRLDRIERATASASRVKPAGWWEGDVAEERRVKDDGTAGRLAWRDAWRSARYGLEAMDQEDLAKAESFLWIATDFLVNALWSRMRSDDIEFLSQSAGSRGRPTKNAERDQGLMQAVKAQEELGLKGKAARQAALNADPGLSTAFRDVADDTLRKIIARVGKKPGGPTEKKSSDIK